MHILTSPIFLDGSILLSRNSSSIWRTQHKMMGRWYSGSTVLGNSWEGRCVVALPPSRTLRPPSRGTVCECRRFQILELDSFYCPAAASRLRGSGWADEPASARSLFRVGGVSPSPPHCAVPSNCAVSGGSVVFVSPDDSISPRRVWIKSESPGCRANAYSRAVRMYRCDLD